MKFYLFIVLLYIKNILCDDSIQLIDETLLTFQGEKCNDNPFLYLLPNRMRHTIELTLKKKPKKNKLGFCRNENSGKTCCTSFTKQNVESYLIDHVYTPKQNIYKKNMYYYKDLLNEHKRNLIKGFKLKESDYNELFSTYKTLINKIIEIDERIVKMSVEYNWDAFCNYICNYPDSLQNCKIYALRYKVNDKMLYDFKYECSANQDFINEFVSLLNQFYDYKHSLNNSIETFYEEIINKNTDSINSKIDSKLLTLYNNSIYDGLYVSKQLNQPSLCEYDNQTNWINYYLNGSLLIKNTDCDTIIAQPCSLFHCLDAFFLEFFDTNENNSTDIIVQFNYTKVTLNLKSPSDMIYFNFTDDIEKLIDKKLTFTKGKYLHIKKALYIIFIIIFFETLIN